VKKPYFLQSFLIVLLATILFLGLKEILPTRIFSEIPTNNANIVVDSLMLEALAKEEIITNEPEDIPVATPLDSISNVSFRANDHKILVAFFEKLEQLEKTGEGEIRIAYFGDSMTDGDYIVQDMRKLFQNEFGGKGVGFVSITSESAASRGSIRHDFSKNWHTQSYVNVKKPLKPFGVNGQASFVKDSLSTTWVEYKASYQKNVSELYNPTLFYGGSNNKDAYVEVFYNGDTTKVVKPLPTDLELNKLKLSDKNLKSIKMNFVNADSIAFYGINSDDNIGVHIDNFSSRGNSGLPLSLFETSFMNEFDKELGGYDLIVLHYGTNVLNYGNLNYSWYEKAMARVVNHLRNCFPDASFLIVSTADKSTKYGMEMKTDSAVVPLANSQRRYAETTRSGFVNLYTLMGGDGSMVRWVEDEPALGNKDYTHFNTKGSQKIARFIFDELKKEYTQFKKNKSISSTE
jgi:lysophospholipase L1-like esterase